MPAAFSPEPSAKGNLPLMAWKHGSYSTAGLFQQIQAHYAACIFNCRRMKKSSWSPVLKVRYGTSLLISGHIRRTYKQWQGFELTDENRQQIYIPKGFAHGFQTLSDNAEVGYLISTFYEPSAGAGVRHDDPAFGIEWPLQVTVISDKDRNWPDFGP